MCRRCVGGLPLERRGLPRVALGLRPVKVAPDHVVEEDQLGNTHDQRHDRDEGVQHMGRFRNERDLIIVVIAPRHAQKAQIMHREIDQIGSDERDPEMQLAQRNVPHPAGDLGIPVVDGSEDNQDGGHAHHHVEVGDHEIGARKRDVHADIAKEQAGQSAIDERKDEADGEQHRDREMNVALPQGQHPIVDLEGSGDGDDQRGDGEQESEIRIHPADIHVVRPHDEAEATDDHKRPHHHPVAEDVFSGMDGDKFGHEAERRQGDDVDLRMTEKPEQVLKQNRATPVVIEMLPH